MTVNTIQYVIMSNIPFLIIFMNGGYAEIASLLSKAIGKEVPDKVKLQQLSTAMYKEDKEEGKREFSELLSSLTPEYVSFCNLGKCLLLTRYS